MSVNANQPPETRSTQTASLVLEGLMIADGLLTLANRIAKWVETKREIGELTPEEDAALDAYMEQRFAQWQTSPGTKPNNPNTGQMT